MPFLFIFNTELLLIDVGSVRHFLVVVVSSIVAMGCFVAATQNWLLVRNRWYETVMLLLISFTLFRPGYWLDRLQAPFDRHPASELIKVAEATPQGLTLRFRVMSQSRAGDDVEKLVRLTMRSGRPGRNACRKPDLGS